MDGITAVELIKQKFQNIGRPIAIPLKKGRYFTATLTEDGIEVDNLGNQPLLPWKIFAETINLLVRNGGRAERGDAMNSKLGDPDLTLDSIEGYIAHNVYGKQIGESVFRRISPIAAILEWAGLCDSAPRELILR